MNATWLFRAYVFCVLVLFVGTDLVTRVHQHSENTIHINRFGHFTESEVISLSEPVCRRFVGASGPINLTADLQEFEDSYIWNVQCTDSIGGEVVNIAWNAGSGEIDRVGVGKQIDMQSTGACLSQNAVTCFGNYWLFVLSQGQLQRKWRIVNISKGKHGRSWYIHYLSDSRRANIELDSISGSLIYASCFPAAPRPHVTWMRK